MYRIILAFLHDLVRKIDSEHRNIQRAGRSGLKTISQYSFQKINEKPQVITDYEAGRAIPNQQILGKLERALGNYFFPTYCKLVHCNAGNLRDRLKIYAKKEEMCVYIYAIFCVVINKTF